MNDQHLSLEEQISALPEDKRELAKKLAEKLRGKPDFLQEEDYLHGGTRPEIVQVAKAELPTKFGMFQIVGFHEQPTGKEHTALICGDISHTQACPVRVHSQCHTGDVLGSLRCDCQAQLEAALLYMAEKGVGALLYLQQEGRGIGLLNKIKAYQLQDLGLDTVEANLYLGFAPDARNYLVAAQMIRLLQINSVALMTNNPEKIDGLKALDINVVDRIPLIIPENRHNKHYLETKKLRMGHLF